MERRIRRRRSSRSWSIATLRDRDVGRARLRFFAGTHVAQRPVERRNVPTGQVSLSTRDLTRVDLVEHPGPGGGIDNVATVLTELGPLDGARLATASVQRARAGWAGC
jgi:predicted transcriptional regulator of viral defense system